MTVVDTKPHPLNCGTLTSSRRPLSCLGQRCIGRHSYRPLRFGADQRLVEPGASSLLPTCFGQSCHRRARRSHRGCDSSTRERRRRPRLRQARTSRLGICRPRKELWPRNRGWKLRRWRGEKVRILCGLEKMATHAKLLSQLLEAPILTPLARRPRG